MSSENASAYERQSRSLMQSADSGHSISEKFNQELTPEMQKLVAAEMQRLNIDLKYLPHLLISGVDQDHDGKIDALVDVYDSRDGKDLYNRPAEADNSDEAQRYRASAKTADAIEKACNGGSGIGVDKDVIKSALMDMNADERKLLNEVYKQRHGIDLEEQLKREFKGEELKEMLAYLNRKDGGGDLSRSMLGNWVEQLKSTSGNERYTVENKILRQVQGLNADDIAALDPKLRESLTSGQNMSESTREMLNIYLKGSDRRTADDELKLARLAMEDKDSERFKMVMSNASDEARRRFQSEGLDKQLEKAFGDDAQALRHAADYASHGERQTDTKIIDNIKWTGDNEEQIEQAIRSMSAQQKAAYASGKELAYGIQTGKIQRDSLSQNDKSALNVYDKISGSLLKATGGGSDQEEFQKYERMILTKDTPKSAQERLVEKLKSHESGADPEDVVRDLQDAFRDDPSLRSKINADAALKEQIESSLKTSLGAEGYEKYGRRLLETGRLETEDIKKFNEGTVDDDEARFYRDMADLGAASDPASAAEKDRILSDKNYQEEVFSNLNESERAVALNALKQGKLQPEDRLRSFVLGSGEDRGELNELLDKLPDEEKDRVKSAYNSKYGNWQEDVGALKKADRQTLMQALETNGLGMQDNHAVMIEEHGNIRGNAFSHKVDRHWDGTGHELDESLDRHGDHVADASSKHEQMSAEDIREDRRDFARKAVAHIESEHAAAGAVADAAVAVASVGLAVPTGGVSLAVLGKCTAAGAAIKVGVKEYLLRDQYDGSEAARDAATGAVDGALGTVSGGVLGQMLKAGKGAAGTAAERVAGELGENAFKEGGEKALKEGMESLVEDAVKNNAGNIDADKINQLAKAVSKSDDAAEHARMAEKIQQSLQHELDQQGRTTVETAATEARESLVGKTSLETAAGTLQGITGSAVYGLGDWDDNKSVTQNASILANSMLVGSVFGGAAGGAGSRLGADGAGRVSDDLAVRARHEVSETAAAKVRIDGTDLDLSGLAASDKPVAIGRAVEGQRTLNPTISSEHATIFRNGDGELAVKETRAGGSTNGTWVKGPDEKEFHRLEPGKEFVLQPGCEVRVGGNGKDASTAIPIEGVGDLPPSAYKRGAAIENDQDATIDSSIKEPVKRPDAPGPKPKPEPGERSSGVTVELGDRSRYTLGSGNQNIVIDDNRVSTRHAEIGKLPSEKHPYVIDYYSPGGTWIKEEGAAKYTRIKPGEPIELKPGTQLQLGGGPDGNGVTVNWEGKRTTGDVTPDGNQARAPETAGPGDKNKPPQNTDSSAEVRARINTAGDAGSPDEAQKLLADALKDDPQLLEKAKVVGLGNNNSGNIREVELKRPDGSSVKLIVHITGESSRRTAQEQSMTQMSRSLFDRFPPATEMTVPFKGQPVKARVQVHAGEAMDVKFAGQNLDSLARQNPDLEKSFRQAAIERYIFGDVDTQSRNFVVSESNGRPSVANIDMEEGFGLDVPDRMVVKSDELSPMYERLSERGLDSTEQGGVQQFLKDWDTAEGRTKLRSMGLSEPQISAMFGRARRLLDRGFPEPTDMQGMTRQEREAMLHQSQQHQDYNQFDYNSGLGDLSDPSNPNSPFYRGY